MNTVLHFRKELSHPPVAPIVSGIAVRPISVPEDVAAWLDLRMRAAVELTPAVRAWTHSDFFAEIVGKPPLVAHTWVAVSAELRGTMVGSVTLAIRKGSTGSVPVVHWLLVDSACRRRGVGRMLMSQLERAAWDDGWREVHIETHAGWTAAVAFYQSIGYAPL